MFIVFDYVNTFFRAPAAVFSACRRNIRPYKYRQCYEKCDCAPLIFAVSARFDYFRKMEQNRPPHSGETPAPPEETTPDIKGELRRIYNVKIRHNRSVFVLLVIFVIILVIWFLKQVENGYSISAWVMPVYTETPKGYSSRELSTQKIRITVRMNGLNMLSYAIGARKLEVELGKVVEHAHGRHFWVPAKHPELLARAVLPADRVEHIAKDTIFLNMGDETVKTVPVELAELQTTFRPGFGLFDPITVSPARVKVFGTPEEIASIDRIVLPARTYRYLSGSLTDSVAIVLPPSLRRVRVEPTRIAVSITVKPYTEGTIRVPVRATGVPSGYTVRFFPSRVTLRYRVAVEDYARIEEKDFRVTVDMSRTDPESRFVYPKISSSPAYAGKVTLAPERVQYIYRKR